MLRGRGTPSLDTASAYAWIIKFCREAPLKDAQAAFWSLDAELGRGAWPVAKDSAKVHK